MQFSNVELSTYRNIESQRLELHPSANFFVGANGQGKTNLLEALYVLIAGESFRPGHHKMLPMIAPEGEISRARIQAEIIKNELGFQVKSLWNEGRKSIVVNDKPRSRSFLSQIGHVVLFSPESLASIKEGPEHRRRLIDELALSLERSYSNLSSDFKKSLKARNRILKDFKQGHYSESETLEILESLNIRYLSLAAEVTQARIRALLRVKKGFSEACLLYTSPSPRDRTRSRMPSSA